MTFPTVFFSIKNYPIEWNLFFLETQWSNYPVDGASADCPVFTHSSGSGQPPTNLKIFETEDCTTWQSNHALHSMENIYSRFSAQNRIEIWEDENCAHRL